jgi:pyruvate/2-oxoglutarate dehydrogenase complex dihydrolipoamide acyltransferase (E2) component
MLKKFSRFGRAMAPLRKPVQYNFGNNLKVTNNTFKFMQMPVRDFGSIVKVQLPDLGEGTKEATVKEWYVQPGTKVEEFDDLVEVFTDKLVAKIPATCSGVVKEISYEADEVCLVGHSLLTIETEDDVQAEQETTTSSSSSDSSTEEELPSAATPTSGPGKDNSSKVLSTPAVRNMAKKNNVDLSKVNATGKGGRVTKEDLINYMSGSTTQIATESTLTEAPAAPQVK